MTRLLAGAAVVLATMSAVACSDNNPDRDSSRASAREPRSDVTNRPTTGQGAGTIVKRGLNFGFVLPPLPPGTPTRPARPRLEAYNIRGDRIAVALLQGYDERVRRIVLRRTGQTLSVRPDSVEVDMMGKTSQDLGVLQCISFRRPPGVQRVLDARTGRRPGFNRLRITGQCPTAERLGISVEFKR